ncbi:MAG: ABC transporter ATP-binding protein [Thermoguttaceae bacterium]
MIEVHNLCKKYGEEESTSFYAVDRVSFSAQSGEIFGLLGPNGAGKTTILRILSTILLPSSGTVNIAGFDVVDHPDSVRANIGYISNNTAVYDRMTAWEMVAYFGELYGLEKRELRDRMESLFERLQMNDFRDRLGEKMSTGMKQKVSIARALIHNPPVLIFDEPTIGLDVLVARSLLQMIQQLRKEGKCIVFSTHIMREVERLCDRVAILNRGQILANGTVLELCEKYSEPDLEELFFQLVV